jgi:DNA repair photolyase
VTKSWLVERYLELLADMARKHLVQVMVSITTLRHDLSRYMEPRAAAPARRLKVIQNLHEAGIPVGVLVAPLIPVLSDAEMEAILAQAREAGAGSAGYVLLRLPHEVKDLFREWLEEHEPTKAEHVMQRIRDSRGGKDYNAEFGERMRGTGVFADLIAQRFRMAHKRLEYGEGRPLETRLFQAPRQQRSQLELF